MTLLEAMLAISLFSIVISVVAPSIKSIHRVDNPSIGEDIRFQLQQLANDSWLNNESYYVSVNMDKVWIAYRLVDEEYMKVRVLFKEQEGSWLEINKIGNAKTDVQIIFYASGEYTPFTIKMITKNSTLSLSGDGINDLQIQ